MPEVSCPLCGQESCWWRMKDAAAYLGVTVSTLDRWCNDGKVKQYRFVWGGRRFKREDLDLLLKA